jgi:hypothetical protein
MQYEIKDTVGFPVIASVDSPIRSIALDGTVSTSKTVLAGERVGFSSGITKDADTSKGTITILNLQDDGWGSGENWVDLSKVYFTTDFGFGNDEIKHSVKGSANYDNTDTDKATAKIIADNNTTNQEARDNILKSVGAVIDIITGKPKVTKPVVNTDPEADPNAKTGINWQPIIKWGLIGLAVMGAIFLTFYLVKDKPDEVKIADPKNDVPTLQGVNIPIPKNLT